MLIINTQIMMTTSSMNTKHLSVNDEHINGLRNRGRSERASSLALPHNSLLDFYDKQQEQCNSVALLPTNINVVVRRHSSHYYPMLEDKQQQHQQQHQQQQYYHQQQQKSTTMFNGTNGVGGGVGFSIVASPSTSTVLMTTTSSSSSTANVTKQHFNFNNKTTTTTTANQLLLVDGDDISSKTTATAAAVAMAASSTTATSTSVVNTNIPPSATTVTSPLTNGLTTPPPPIPKRTFRGKYAWNCVAPVAASSAGAAIQQQSTIALSPTKSKQQIAQQQGITTGHNTFNFYQHQSQQQQQQPLVYYQQQSQPQPHHHHHHSSANVDSTQQQALYVDIAQRQLYSDIGCLDSGTISDDDRMSLENSVFDESLTSTPVKIANAAKSSGGGFVSLLASKTLAALTNDLSNAAKRANRSSSSTVDSTTTTASSGYGSHSERLASNSTTADFRSRFSSVDTQSSLDSCLAEKTSESPLSKDSFKIERSLLSDNMMADYNQLNNNHTTNNNMSSLSPSNNNTLGRHSTNATTTLINSSSQLLAGSNAKLPAVPVRKQYSIPPKIPPPLQQSATNISQQSLSNGSKTSSVSTSTSTSSAASAASGTSSGSSMSISAAGGGNSAISPVSLQQSQLMKRPCQAPTPPSRTQGQSSFDSVTGQLIFGNMKTDELLTTLKSAVPPPPLTVRNKLVKNKPPPIVYPKLHQRQDSSLSSDSYSVTSSPGYNTKNLMDAPLLQNAARINKGAPGMAMRHQDSNDSFGMVTSRYAIGNPIPPLRGKSNYRQDSTISSDSFSQTSSPGYNTKIMEAPLLPTVKRMCSIPAPIVCKQKLQNETIDELEQQTVPMSPLTKSVPTPASLQTIVRFQNGAPNTTSLQHRIVNRRKSSNPYITNGRLKFRFFQILLNAFALLAIAGGLAAYFNAYPTIKFVNKTIINTIRVEEVSTMGKNPAPGTCLPIIVKFCQGPQIPYNYTVFPNYIGHFGQIETQVDLDNYDALVDVRCYELVSLFLCTLFVPKCGTTGSTVPPCKTLCTETMRRCGFFFDVFGLSLPEWLNCKLFKDFENPEECVGLEQVQDVMIALSNPVCNGFQCDQARCIPNDYVCDGHLDCMDQTDESSCDRCDADSIYCGENRCMSSKHICDGIVDCPYGQDERNCIRLSERNGDLGKGVLEVFRISTHKWTPACVKNWDRSVSPTAVCSMLGYNSVNATSVVTQKTHRPLLTSVNVSTDIWKMYAKKRSNLMQEFASCKPEEDYPIAELTCANFECGKVKRRRHDSSKISRRIIGGAQANPGSWPFLAAILGGPEKIFYCAGVLISDQWVLTASHCIGNHTVIDLDDWTIQLGVTRRNSFTYSGQKVKVKTVIPHPMYNTLIPHDNDIALFQLAQRVSFHEHLLPVCLPPPSIKNLKSDQLCTVIGWGKSQDNHPKATYEPIVNEVQVPVIRRQQCDEWLDNLTVSDGMICAGYEDGGKDACQGDSGGPLLCPFPGEKDRWFVGGIVSWGIMCAHPKLPGVYANVIKYIPWIHEQIQKYTKPSKEEEKISKFSNVPGGGAGSSLNISPGASPFKSNSSKKQYGSNSNQNRSPMDIDYYGSYEKT